MTRAESALLGSESVGYRGNRRPGKMELQVVDIWNGSADRGLDYRPDNYCDARTYTNTESIHLGTDCGMVQAFCSAYQRQSRQDIRLRME